MRFARVTKPGSDSDQFHTQQLEYLGKTANSIMVFPYGLHANTSEDSLALMFGVQDKRASIAWSPKNRPLLAGGEVTVYHPETNSTITWKKGGKLEITTDADMAADVGGSVTINTTTLTLNGNLVVNGTMTNNGQDVGNTHKHSQGSDSGGDSQQNISGVI